MKGKAEHTNAPGLTFTGEDSIGLSSVTWENVLIHDGKRKAGSSRRIF